MPVLNKVGQFLMAQPLHHITGQVRSKLDFTALMDGSSIFLANLAKGRIGEHNAMLLGSLSRHSSWRPCGARTGLSMSGSIFLCTWTRRIIWPLTCWAPS